MSINSPVFFTRSTWLLVLSPTNLVQRLTFLLFISADGKESPLPFRGPSQSFGFYLLPLGQAIFLGLLDVTQVPFFFHQVTQYKHLFFHSDLGLLLWDWPTFFHVLTAILWRLATVNSNGRIVLILFLSSQWDTTWQKKYDCMYCQRNHVKGMRNCPAYGQECFKYKRKNHFVTSKICKSKHEEQGVNECFHIGKETIHKVHVNLRLNGKPIKFILDSGTTVNVVPATFVKDNMEHSLKKGKELDISVYGGKKFRTEGTMRLERINPVNKRKVIASIMVVSEKVQSPSKS